MQVNSRVRQKSRRLALFAATALFAVLAITAQGHSQKITTFDAPNAGTGAGQGTSGIAINASDAIAGYYLDASNVYHGFLRARDGTITVIDAPCAGNGSGQGTGSWSINPAGAIAGEYADANGVEHGYLLAPDGTFTTFEAPDAGTGSGQGTLALNINPAGAIAGYYVDANNVNHGFVRARDGAITEFDAPNAGDGSGQGTYTVAVTGINPAGAITGEYLDANNVWHSYLRAADGNITDFDVWGAGKGSG
ncbi:MAG: hypothetical protein WCC78_04235, partial [Terriglobales bacterium]